jgi:hypothetical protein
MDMIVSVTQEFINLYVESKKAFLEQETEMEESLFNCYYHPLSLAVCKMLGVRPGSVASFLGEERQHKPAGLVVVYDKPTNRVSTYKTTKNLFAFIQEFDFESPETCAPSTGGLMLLKVEKQ